MTAKARKLGFSLGFSPIIVEEIPRIAIERCLIQISRGNLEWVCKEPKPKATLKRLLFSIFFKDALSRVRKLFELKIRKNTSQRLELETSVDPEVYEELDLIFERLSKSEREIISMFHIEGYNIKDIAAILNKSPEAVKQKLYRTRNRMKKLMLIIRDN